MEINNILDQCMGLMNVEKADKGDSKHAMRLIYAILIR